jgi:hypothetical protein
MSKKSFLVLSFLSATLCAQTSSVSLHTISDYDQWGWGAVVMQNGIVTLATVPAIGARVMQYNLGSLQSVMVNSSLLGKTYTPANNGIWYNFGGYKTWPSPQDNWPGGWPPPPTLDYGTYTVTDTIQTSDSAVVGVASQVEQWYTPGIQFIRKATVYNGTSRVKMDQTIINKGTGDVTWGVWSIIQSIANHPGKTDYQNFWTYFPINQNSVFGSSGVSPQGASKAWKGEVATGIYGVQFSPDGQKIFADPEKSWIAYADLSDTVVFARTFPIFDGMQYPDGGARVSVYVSSVPSGNNGPAYMEVEVKGPLVDLAANGGEYTFTENWWAARVHAPILDVDSVGAIGERLSYSTTKHALSAAYGVFYEGTANLAFIDSGGKVLTEGQQHSVSPLEEFQLEEDIAIPGDAKFVDVQVHDSTGELIGVLETEDISQLATDMNSKARPVPSAYRLVPNYPNPFNGGTVITFYCPEVAQGSLRIYDILGREVAELVSGKFAAGEHHYSWNPENLASGVYVARLKTDGVLLAQKMIYLR